MIRIIILILCCVFPFTSVNALTIGTSSDNPPFSTKIDVKNHFYGFDIDIMTEICKRIQEPCNYLPYTFNQLFVAIDNNAIDLAISAITISSERELRYLFSSPYYISQAQFMVLNTSTVKSLSDLRGKRIGVIGNPTQRLVEKLYKGNVTVKEFPEILDLLAGLNNDEIDAVVMDRGEVQYWFANSEDQYKMLHPSFDYGTGYGIMANKAQAALMNRVNDALLNMKADKTYDVIYARYFG